MKKQRTKIVGIQCGICHKVYRTLGWAIRHSRMAGHHVRIVEMPDTIGIYISEVKSVENDYTTNG